MRKNNVEVPQALLDQRTFAKEVSENNQRILEHVDFLRTLAQNLHQMHTQLSKSITELTDSAEKKVSHLKDDNSQCVANFIKRVGNFHRNALKQVRNNIVSLGSKNHRIARSRHDVLHNKLEKADGMTQQFLQRVDRYNTKYEQFRDECGYFHDYEKDVLKYYSVSHNNQIYDKLVQKELSLRTRLQDLYLLKGELKVGICEIRVSLKEFFQIEKSLIGEYCKLILLIRESLKAARIYNESIIEEVSEQAFSSFKEQPVSSQHLLNTKPIASSRRDIAKEHDREIEVEDVVEKLIIGIQEEVGKASEALDEMHKTKEYLKFIQERMLMHQILSAESIRHIDEILSEIALFRQILKSLQESFGQVRVLNELKKYRGFSFTKFMQETEPYLQAEKRAASDIVLEDYQLAESKFEERHAEYMYRFKEIINLLYAEMERQYCRPNQVYQEGRRKKNSKTDIFERRYYEIMFLPFFLNMDDQLQFEPAQELLTYAQQLEANKLQQATIELQQTESPYIEKRRSYGCCGLVRSGTQQVEIDDYNCALKEGMMLVQGKFKIYLHYFTFKSSFNSRTLFGNSDIKVPKWDIIEIVRGKHLLSLMVTIVTVHGKLEFTSFITDPIDKLMQLYDNRTTAALLEQQKNCTELQRLQQRFQRELPSQMKKKGFLVDKLNTYLPHNGSSLSISVQYHAQQSTPQPNSRHNQQPTQQQQPQHVMPASENLLRNIEIKINQVGNSIDYCFVHSPSDCEQTTGKVNAIAKQLINGKGVIDNRPRAMQDVSMEFDSCSVIQSKEPVKLSFSKEPSFLKKDSAEQMVSQDILKRMEEEPTGDFIPIIRSKLINTGASSSNTRSPSELDLSCIHAGFKKPMTSKELEQSEKPKMHSDLLSKLPTTKCSIQVPIAVPMITPVSEKKQKASATWSYRNLVLYLSVLMLINLCIKLVW